MQREECARVFHTGVAGLAWRADCDVKELRMARRTHAADTEASAPFLLPCSATRAGQPAHLKRSFLGRFLQNRCGVIGLELFGVQVRVDLGVQRLQLLLFNPLLLRLRLLFLRYLNIPGRVGRFDARVEQRQRARDTRARSSERKSASYEMTGSGVLSPRSENLDRERVRPDLHRLMPCGAQRRLGSGAQPLLGEFE